MSDIVRPYGDTTGPRERSEPRGSGTQRQTDRTAQQATTNRVSAGAVNTEANLDGVFR